MDVPSSERKCGVFVLLCDQAGPRSAARGQAASAYRILDRYRPTIEVTSCRQLARELGKNQLGIGVIVERGQFERSAWCKLVSLTRDAAGELSVQTNALDPSLCTLDGVALIQVPAASLELRDFAARALVREVLTRPVIACAVLALVKRHDLSPREGELLAAAVAGVRREALFEEVGTSPNTVKRQVRSLLCKCGESSVDRLIIRVLHQALRAGATAEASLQPATTEVIFPRDEEATSALR